MDSPVSNDGCGLKPPSLRRPKPRRLDSPVSNDGCGLKQVEGGPVAPWMPIHPSAMTGVD